MLPDGMAASSAGQLVFLFGPDLNMKSGQNVMKSAETSALSAVDPQRTDQNVSERCFQYKVPFFTLTLVYFTLN